MTLAPRAAKTLTPRARSLSCSVVTAVAAAAAQERPSGTEAWVGPQSAREPKLSSSVCHKEYDRSLPAGRARARAKGSGCTHRWRRKPHRSVSVLLDRESWVGRCAQGSAGAPAPRRGTRGVHCAAARAVTTHGGAGQGQAAPARRWSHGVVIPCACAWPGMESDRAHGGAPIGPRC